MRSILVLTLLFLSVLPAPAQQPDHLDFRVLRALAEHRTPAKNRFYKIVSDLTMPMSLAEPTALYGTGLARRDKALRQQALYGLESIAVSSVVTVSMKEIIGRPRPYVRDPLFIPVTHAGLKSFPSGHTSLAFSSATALTLAFPKWYVAAPAYGWTWFGRRDDLSSAGLSRWPGAG